MYEKNLQPLPDGDAVSVFGPILAQMRERARVSEPRHTTADSVISWANQQNQPLFAQICRRLLLPGSGLVGFENLLELGRLARAGESCLLCLSHGSNLDVPTLYTLLADEGHEDLFNRVVWIAGRKLTEDHGLTPMMAECFNRVVVTPPSYLEKLRTEEERQEARRINLAALRRMKRLMRDGWIFALFPSATRLRPGKEITAKAIEETDGYLRGFDHVVLCHIAGCTMPVSRDHNMSHETPRLDRVIYTFGPVLRADEWRGRAAARHPLLEQRHATAQAIMEDIHALGAANEATPALSASAG